MDSKTHCSVEGCSDAIKARGLCVKHYQRLIRNGSIFKQEKYKNKTCSVDTCEETVVAKGYCKHHYNKLRSMGKIGTKKRCQVSNCNEPHHAKGYCTHHYYLHMKKANN